MLSAKNAYHRHWYAKNKFRIRKRKLQLAMDRRKSIRDAVWAYKESRGCADCSEKDPVVLEFDHTNGEDKTDEISNLIHRGVCLERVMEEVTKCVVRCANCHRRPTAKQGRWL